MSFFYNEETDTPRFARIVLTALFVIGLFFAFSMFINPMLKPWWAQQDGKAELAQAEQNRQIAILEAQAKLESAERLANAEIARARGIAEANRIIGDSITPNYLKYRFIEGLNDGSTETIYVPTEANLPILEAREK